MLPTTMRTSATSATTGREYSAGPRTMSAQHPMRPRIQTSTPKGRSLSGKKLSGVAATNAGATSRTPVVVLPHQRIQLTAS